MTPDHVIAAKNILGEGIQWHAQSGLWWTDIQQSMLYQQPIGIEAVLRHPTPERVGSFSLVEGDETRLMCAFETGFGYLNLTTGEIEWIARLEQPGSGRRFNDGKVDRQGRFWAGTMIEDGAKALPGSAALYCLDGKQARLRHDRVSISNGLAWSLDGRTMYFADSPRRTIFAFDFDVSSGEIGRPRVFAGTPSGAYPDGATVDAENCLWSAHWGASRVVRYSPGGKIDRVIEVPVSQPSCIAFGGNALDLIFVTTAREGLNHELLAIEPLAGDVLVYRAGVSGVAEERFRPVHERDL